MKFSGNKTYHQLFHNFKEKKMFFQIISVLLSLLFVQFVYFQLFM